MIDELVFGWYETDDFGGPNIGIIEFNHETDEAFHKDYKTKIGKMISNGSKHLSILRIANENDLREIKHVLSEA